MGADNQQERFSLESIPVELGSFLAGFALGEASFMVVCRRRPDYRRGWRISAAFNVSQVDLVPLELFQRTLGCGTLRMAGSGGWYFEVNRLTDLAGRVIPFFRRFPLVGSKAEDFLAFSSCVELLSKPRLTDDDYHTILTLRERMNRGGKRRNSTEKILRDYTPSRDGDRG
jgi:LAGLIDADG endonuclease.